MGNFSSQILGVRIFISTLGIMGNVALILVLIQKQFSHLKTFEVLLLGLAVSNLEGIFIVDVYDVLIVHPSVNLGVWACRTLNFLTVFGEVASILFTVLISVFRYQKLRHAENNLHVFLDNSRYAWVVSGLCVTLALIIGTPTYLMNLDGHMENVTLSKQCPPDFFQCPKTNCPLVNRLYKYLYIVVFNIIPLVIVTVSSCLIIKVLLEQKRKVNQALESDGAEHPHGRENKGFRIQRCTIAILTAMGLFQVDWTFYLALNLYTDPHEFPGWSDAEFTIFTIYTTVSPFVYGVGNHLFSWKFVGGKWRFVSPQG